MKTSPLKIAAAAAILVAAGHAQAGNAPGSTPVTVAVLPNIIYRVAYWVDNGDFKTYPTIDTTIIITGLTRLPCNYQVQWVSPAGVTVGYTGINPNYEGLTTQVLTSIPSGVHGNFPPLPIMNEGLGVPFVYSNMVNPTVYGFANIRTDCAAGTKAVVAAYLATYNSAPTAGNGQLGPAPTALVPVPVTAVAGTAGD